MKYLSMSQNFPQYCKALLGIKCEQIKLKEKHICHLSDTQSNYALFENEIDYFSEVIFQKS